MIRRKGKVLCEDNKKGKLCVSVVPFYVFRLCVWIGSDDGVMCLCVKMSMILRQREFSFVDVILYGRVCVCSLV